MGVIPGLVILASPLKASKSSRAANSPLLHYKGIVNGMSTLPFNIVLHSEQTEIENLSSSYSPKRINPFAAFVHRLLGARISPMSM